MTYATFIAYCYVRSMLKILFRGLGRWCGLLTARADALTIRDILQWEITLWNSSSDGTS